MGQILFAGGGGGTVNSDDLTATAAHVLKGDTYMGNDTDDEEGTGTMPNIDAVDNGPSLAVSGNTLNCRMNNGAHIQNASSGYPEVAYPLATVRSAINYTNSAKVLSDTTICGLTGTMPNIAALDPMKSVVLSGSNLYVRMSPGGHVTNASSGYPEVYGAATSFISALGVSSITNFKCGQYSSQKLLFTWSQPSKGLWSGIRIVANQSRYPNNATDGTYWDSGSTWMATGTLNTGTWYIRAWNYVTWSGGRYYGGYSQGSYNNVAISGNKTFTSSTSWTVPTAVRSLTVFLVGGGGGAYNPAVKANRASGGAGGGYTKTTTISVTPGETLTISVPGGGTYQGGTAYIARNGSWLASAAGGYGGYTGDSTMTGFNGGSGGGGAQGIISDNAYAVPGRGGTDGGNGGTAHIHNPLNHGSDYNYVSGGTGQGYSTKAWGNSGTPYSPGGGGASYDADSSGDGSRGAGLTGNNSGAGANGVGNSKCDDKGTAHWDYGASGIVMVKW